MMEYKKKALFSELKKFDPIAGESDYIEVTLWKNGDGFDVEIASKLNARFQLTWGEWVALKKLIALL